MDSISWTILKDGEDGRFITPVPYTGESEEFSVKIIDEEFAGVMDDNGDIQFAKVMELYLPHFDRDVLDNAGAFGHERPPLNLWEWQADRMGNYMLYLIDHHGLQDLCQGIWRQNDEDLEVKHQDTATLQKWVNLYDIMLDTRGHE